MPWAVLLIPSFLCTFSSHLSYNFLCVILFLPFLFDELVKFEDKRVLTESRQGSCSCFPFLHFSHRKYALKAKGIQKVFKDKRVLTESRQGSCSCLHLYRQNLYSMQKIFKKYLKRYLKTISFINILYLKPSAVNWPLSNA